MHDVRHRDGEDPEVESLVERRSVAIDKVGRSLGHRGFEQGPVFRQGEVFDGLQRPMHGLGQSAGRGEHCRPRGTEPLEVVHGGGQQRGSRSGERILNVFEELCKQGAEKLPHLSDIGEQFELRVHTEFLVFGF
ncbi:MAG TPA: hypothetical protein VNZ64_22465 [Candidatus Acidoferrum sp.]|nr:hypothetical protein [Candidatus Acidoferrum sp.]